MAYARLHGLDFARFLAFAGMVIVNFRIAMGADSVQDSGSEIAQSVAQLLEGRAAATFVVLAGLGFGLAVGHKARAQIQNITLRRSAFLLVIGLLNSLIFDADILHYYAFYFLGALLVIQWSSLALWGTMGALNLCFVAMILILDYDQGWNWQTYTYADFWTISGFLRNLMFNGWHPIIPWGSFMIFGIWLARLSLDKRRVQLALIMGGACAVACAEGVARILATTTVDPEVLSLLGTVPVPPMPLYIITGSGVASVVIGCSLVIGNLAILRIFQAAGRQSLTLYIAHILLGMGTLEALGMLEGQDSTTALNAALLFIALSVIYALIWTRVFSHGPIEFMMRKLAG